MDVPDSKVNQSKKNAKETADDTQDVSASSKYNQSKMDAWMWKTPNSVAPNSEVYKMNHKRRGLAIIFNHVNFTKMAPRTGSNKDCANLEDTLTRLGFNVKTYLDPSIKQISAILKQAAEDDHRDADCLIVAAMSHGESGYLFTSDDTYLVEMLWDSFTADKCTTLIGKPKLFFIQACRGAQLDGGATIMHETDSGAAYSIPSYADIMVAYSTYDGFFSWRNPDSGSWFIQALCAELNEHGLTRDLLTMMTFVNRRVAVEFESYVPQDKRMHKKKQIPSIVSMLTRLVYFGKPPL
ncbi:caspase-1-like isoform X1 [Colletes latitarsis]|uniref:caspase-1-like isoform X1 n=1 Tax=Colletes latitarsis TaxID=2605962 RepID=UPI004037322A